MAGLALRIVKRILANNIHVGIMAGDATDSWVRAVEALAIGQTIGLKSNSEFAAPVISNHGLPTAMTLAAEVR